MSTVSYHQQQDQRHGSRQLYDLLNRLGYQPPTGTISPESLEWVFSYEATNPLMRHLCSTLDASFLLCQEDIIDYEDLEKQGKTLSGQELEQAIKIGANRYHKQQQQQQVHISKLELQCEQLTNELEELEKRLERKREQRDQLVSLSNLAHHTEHTLHKGLWKDHEEQLIYVQRSASSRSREFDQSLDDLCQSSMKLIDSFNSSLCRIEFGDYSCEDKLTSQILEQLLGSLLLQGQDNDIEEKVWSSYHQDCKELERLRQCYAASEEQFMIALITCSKLRASLETTRRIQSLWHVYSSQYLGNDAAIRDKCQQFDQRIDSIRRELSVMMRPSAVHVGSTPTIPELIQELVQLHSVPVVEGDYDLAVSRRVRHIQLLDEMLEHVSKQRSIHAVLEECLTHEQERIQRAYHLLRAAEHELVMLNDELCRRQQRYQSMMADQTVHASDTVSMIERSITVLQEAQSQSSRIIQVGQEMADDVQSRYQRLERALFGHDDTSRHPKLVPQELVESMQSLRDILDQLGTDLKTVIREREERQMN